MRSAVCPGLEVLTASSCQQFTWAPGGAQEVGEHLLGGIDAHRG